MNERNQTNGFDALSEADEVRIRQLIREGHPIAAIAELRSVTGSGLKEAKQWVDDVWSATQIESPAMSCPYCGLMLRTPTAKQCRHCRRDWHDADNLKWLGE